jgi:hypothetical protein
MPAATIAAMPASTSPAPSWALPRRDLAQPLNIAGEAIQTENPYSWEIAIAASDIARSSSISPRSWKKRSSP